MSRTNFGIGWILVGALGVMNGVATDAEAFQGRPAVQIAASKPSESAEKMQGEVVYQWRKTVARNGRVEENVVVDTVMVELESGEIQLNVDRMVDTLGRSYEMSADAYQATEESDVVYEIKLRRIERSFMTEAERESAWLLAHPKATDADLEDFRTKRTTPPEPPTTKTQMKDELRTWLSTARPSDTIEVVIQLQETESPLNLPKVASNLFQKEPALALAQMKDRLLTIERRKNELSQIQAPVISDLTRAGGKFVKPYWLINGFRAVVSPAVLRTLGNDKRVLRIEPFEKSIPDTNNLDDMRAAAQVVQLHDAGADGETGSGRSSVGDMYIAIIDDNIDADHPAWRDTSSTTSSRLTAVWRETSGVWGTVSTSATTTPSHGTKVTGIAVADLMQGQDPAITATADRDDRTGFAPEASFAFIESAAGTVDSIEKAVDLSVDVINYSASINYNCDLSGSSNDAVDEAMLDDIFFSKSSGSNATTSTPCNVGTPGAASGAFSVTVTDRAAVPLTSGLVSSGASLGPDANGRAVVAMAAYGGPEGDTAAAVNDTYGVFGATSAAAPVVAGTAASLKDHLLDVFSSAIVNEVGFLYATMLVMGDGQMDSGVALAQDEMDGKWGAGRLRTRMFTAEGMDGPWRMRLISRTISDGEIASDLYLNPDASDINQDLSTDVERIRATVFWHEPNIEDSVTNWATISSTICNDDGFCYGSGNSDDPRQRHRIGNAAGGKKWWIQLNGINVPDSNDSNYHFNLDERKVYVAVYWEDEDRDDADGPASSIQ